MKTHHIELARTVFKGSLVSSKVIFVALLIFFSYKNTYTQFISKSPREFITESMTIGGSMAIPVSLALLVRGYEKSQIAILATTAFATFFFLNVIMEMSGQNEINHAPKLSDDQKKQMDIVDSVKQLSLFKGSVIILGLILIALSFTVRDTGPGVSIILMESIIVGVCATFPAIMQSKNRQKRLNTSTIITTYFIPFAIGHLVLQLGGMYTFK